MENALYLLDNLLFLVICIEKSVLLIPMTVVLYNLFEEIKLSKIYTEIQSNNVKNTV